MPLKIGVLGASKCASTKLGCFYTRCSGNPWFAPRIPVVFVISAVSAISTSRALNSSGGPKEGHLKGDI